MKQAKKPARWRVAGPLAGTSDLGWRVIVDESTRVAIGHVSEGLARQIVAEHNILLAIYERLMVTGEDPEWLEFVMGQIIASEGMSFPAVPH